MKQAAVVGLGGLLASGKDTVADHLVSHYGFAKMGMSDVLHEMMLVLNPYIPVTDEEFGDEKRWERLNTACIEGGFESLSSAGWVIRYKSLTKALGYVDAKEIKGYRAILQTFGTEVGRDMIDPNIWVKLAQKRILAVAEKGTPVVLTATRFPNEIQMMERLDGVTLWVERPTDDDGSVSEVANHASETSVGADDFDFVLVNDGTLQDLYAKVDSWVDENFPGLKPVDPEDFDDLLMSL